MTAAKKSIISFLQTPTGKVLYNIGVIIVVFVLMSFSMTVFAERPGDRSMAQNPVVGYLWRMTHHQQITSLGDHVDYLNGRLYMFKRMQGDPGTWGWQEKEQYDRMYAEFQGQVQRYNDLVLKYNGGDDPRMTSLSPKEFPHDYMPYATR